MRVWAGLSSLALVVLAAGCSTPAETAARSDQEIGRQAEALARAQGGYDAAVAGKDVAVRSAEEWNNHVLGIPASGWVWLLVIAGIAVLAGLIALSVSVYYSLEDKRRIAGNNYAARAKVAEKLAARGACPRCFYEPVPDDMLTAADKKTGKVSG